MTSLVSIIGLIFALFLPGFLITLIFFREVKLLERILLSVAFSIMISIAIGISLGYNQNVKNITGGINQFNVWKWELIVTAVIGVIALIVNIKNINLKNIVALKQKIKIRQRKLSKEDEVVKYKKL